MRRSMLTAGLVLILSARASAEECPTTPAGDPYATGQAAASATADSAGLRRVGAERAAFLDALTHLKTCLGERAKTVTGWSVAAVRYFDSDPIVEVDVSARFDKTPVVTVLGAALPDTSKKGGIDQVRVEATRAAVISARRNAAEALDVVFATEGTAGKVRKTLASTLSACATGEVAYWDDGSVSVKVTCGKGVDADQKTETKPQPAIGKHAQK